MRLLWARSMTAPFSLIDVPLDEHLRGFAALLPGGVAANHTEDGEVRSDRRRPSWSKAVPVNQRLLIVFVGRGFQHPNTGRESITHQTTGVVIVAQQMAHLVNHCGQQIDSADGCSIDSEPVLEFRTVER